MKTASSSSSSDPLWWWTWLKPYIVFISAFFHYLLHKIIPRLLTGRGEIERIIYESYIPGVTLSRVSHSILSSKQLRENHVNYRSMGAGRRKNRETLGNFEQQSKKKFSKVQSFNVLETILMPKHFDERQIALQIIAVKKMQTSHALWAKRALPNLLRVLHHMNAVNKALEAVNQLKKTKFKQDDPIDLNKLNQLWENLMPGVLRRGGRKSEDWKEIGFQGTDPVTDFRGMGMLGLEQLLFFSSHFPSAAQRICAESVQTEEEDEIDEDEIRKNHNQNIKNWLMNEGDLFEQQILDTNANLDIGAADISRHISTGVAVDNVPVGGTNNRLGNKLNPTSRSKNGGPGYPFACVGINLTQFTLELLTNRLLDKYFYHNVATDSYIHGRNNKTTKARGHDHHQHFTTTDNQQQHFPASSSSGIATFHEIYCILYMKFHRAYCESDPPARTLLDFPRIWTAFRTKVKTDLETGQFESQRLLRYTQQRF
eukprot:g2954.t1